MSVECPHPPLVVYDGRAVTWRAWTDTPQGTHLVTLCERCGHKGVQWMTWGQVAPLPGEEFDEPRPGVREVRMVKVKAWPVLRLVAYRCPSCRRVRVHDVHGWVAVPLGGGGVQPSLFPDLPGGDGPPVPAHRRRVGR